MCGRFDVDLCHARLPRTRCDHLHKAPRSAGFACTRFATIAIFWRSRSGRYSTELGGCLEMATESTLAVLDAAGLHPPPLLPPSTLPPHSLSLTKPEATFQ